MRAAVFIVGIALQNVCVFADPCDTPGTLCDCSHNFWNCFDLLPESGSLRDSFLAWAHALTSTETDDGSIAQAVAECTKGNQLSCYLAAGALSGQGRRNEANHLFDAACDHGFAVACRVVGDSARGCLAGDELSCKEIWRARILVDQKRFAVACVKRADATCLFNRPTIVQIETACMHGVYLMCLVYAETIVGTARLRARAIFAKLCPRDDDACLGEARTYMDDDAQKAIDLLTPLCQRDSPGACALLDEASRRK